MKLQEFNIDEILLEANYKSKKGYINLDDINDIKLIENVMYEFGYAPKFITEYINNLKNIATKY